MAQQLVLTRRLALPASLLIAVALAACSGSDEPTEASPGTTPRSDLPTIGIVVETNHGEVAPPQLYAGAVGEDNPDNLYCVWGEAPRFVVSGDEGRVITSGEVDYGDTSVIEGTDELATGPVSELGPTNGAAGATCHLPFTVVSLDEPADEITVTVNGHSWAPAGGLNGGDDWVAEVTTPLDGLPQGDETGVPTVTVEVTPSDFT